MTDRWLGLFRTVVAAAVAEPERVPELVHQRPRLGRRVEGAVHAAVEVRAPGPERHEQVRGGDAAGDAADPPVVPVPEIA